MEESIAFGTISEKWIYVNREKIIEMINCSLDCNWMQEKMKNILFDYEFFLVVKVNWKEKEVLL